MVVGLTYLFEEPMNLKFLIIWFLLAGFAAGCGNNEYSTIRDGDIPRPLDSLTISDIGSIHSFKAADQQAVGNSIGVLVLNDNYQPNDTVKFYHPDGSLWYQFTYYYDDSDGKFDFQNDEFQPIAFHPDYFLLALKTVAEGKDDYEVVVNEATGLTKRIKKQDFLKLQGWEEYILSGFSVGFDLDQNPIRMQPVNSSPILNVENEVSFFPIKLQGEWLQIKWGKEGDWNYGWIRWTERNKLVIEVFAFA